MTNKNKLIDLNYSIDLEESICECDGGKHINAKNLLIAAIPILEEIFKKENFVRIKFEYGNTYENFLDYLKKLVKK